MRVGISVAKRSRGAGSVPGDLDVRRLGSVGSAHSTGSAVLTPASRATARGGASRPAGAPRVARRRCTTSTSSVAPSLRAGSSGQGQLGHELALFDDEPRQVPVVGDLGDVLGELPAALGRQVGDRPRVEHDDPRIGTSPRGDGVDGRRQIADAIAADDLRGSSRAAARAWRRRSKRGTWSAQVQASSQRPSRSSWASSGAMSSPRRTATVGAVGEHEPSECHGAFEVHFAVEVAGLAGRRVVDPVAVEAEVEPGAGADLHQGQRAARLTRCDCGERWQQGGERATSLVWVALLGEQWRRAGAGDHGRSARTRPAPARGRPSRRGSGSRKRAGGRALPAGGRGPRRRAASGAAGRSGRVRSAPPRPAPRRPWRRSPSRAAPCDRP